MLEAPLPLADLPPEALRRVRYVLTDMDDTLTYDGRLSASAYLALERLQRAGIKVVPVTAAPAGWCDQMVRMWPIDAVIGENGGFYSHLTRGRAVRHFWQSGDTLEESFARLQLLRATVEKLLGTTAEPFRLATLAWHRPSDREAIDELQGACRALGADTTLNSIWVLGWFGGFDKLHMARRAMLELYGLDIDHERDAVVYVGDSENDAPMFRHFPLSVGVSTVNEQLHILSARPNWITRGPGGAGFVELTDAILAACP
jgi:HAD superfamily hydrolase (TIGR01484 family)